MKIELNDKLYVSDFGPSEEEILEKLETLFGVDLNLEPSGDINFWVRIYRSAWKDGYVYGCSQNPTVHGT